MPYLKTYGITKSSNCVYGNITVNVPTIKARLKIISSPINTVLNKLPGFSGVGSAIRLIELQFTTSFVYRTLFLGSDLVSIWYSFGGSAPNRFFTK